MIIVVFVGLLVMLACLALQVLASVLAARYFAQASKQPLGPKPLRRSLIGCKQAKSPRKV